MKTLEPQTYVMGFLALVTMGFVLWLLEMVLFPLVLAMFLSIMSRPLVDFLRRKRVPMGLCILAVLIVVAVALGVVALVLTTSVQGFVAAAPRYEAKLDHLIASGTATAKGLLRALGQDPQSFSLSRLVNVNALGDLLLSSVGSMVAVLGAMFMTLLFLVFLVAGSDGFNKKLSRAIPGSGSTSVAVVFETISAQVRRYMLTKTAISVVTATLVGVTLEIAGVDFSLLFALLAFVLNFIPNFGSIIAALFPTLLTLLQYESPGRMIVVAVALILIQNVMGNVVEPKVMGRGLNLSPVTILISLIFWGWLWGIWGMVIAVPVASTIRIICENIESLHPLSVLMGGGE
jgi:AI-2 transport protein TqsA